MAITIKKRDPSSIPNPDTGKVTFSVDLSENPYYKDETGTVFPAIVSLSSTTPQNVGTSGSAGTSTNASRADHSHALTFSTLNSILGSATGSISVNNQLLTNLTDATNPQDALNLRTASATQVSKSNVYYATTTTLPAYTYSNGTAGVGATITGSSTGALSAIDGVSPQAGDSVLVKNETAGNAPNNGIYTVTNAGSVGVAYILTRRTDSDTAAKLAGAFCIIESGTINKSAGFVLSLIPSAITVGTTSLTFTQFNSATTYTGTNGVLVSGLNISAVTADNAISIGLTGIKFAIPYAGLVTGNSKTYLTSDRGNLYRRSNSGSAMTDTLPTLAAGDNGWTLKVHNDGTVVAETITFTSPFGNFTNGTTTYVLQYGCRQTFTWTGSSWEFDAGNANLVRFNGTAVAGNLLSFNDTTGRLGVDSGVAASTVTLNTTQIIAGNGLTGGGNLTTNRTLSALAADTSIGVSASGLTFSLTSAGVVTGASKTYASSDRGKYYKRSNSGVAMTDTMPTLVSGDNGYTLTVLNSGTVVAETITFSAGAATFPSGSSSFILNFGCSQIFVWNGSSWDFHLTNANNLKTSAASVISGNVPSFSDVTGRNVVDSGIVAANIVSNTRQVIAGAGLTGGGALTSDVTLNVIANADGSIVVAADDVKVGVLATDAQHGNRGNGSLHTVVVAAGANGFMSGTDKTKLDGITSGAAVASVGATAPITSSGGTTPNIGITISPGAATTAVGTTRNLTAGTGLTGGGDLSADRTFNVIANADGSIVANADDIQVGVLATDAQHGNRGNGSLHTIVVAGGANGFMSGTDKTKLDSVTSGAAVASVSGTAPIVSSGGTTPAISVTSGDNAIAVTSAGLKFAIPFSSLVTGNSKTYVSGDRGNFYRRSNSGVAMTDTLPTLVSGDNGWTLKVHNDGTVAAEQITFTSPSGTFPGGGTTYVLSYGCRQTFTWTGTGWDFDAGNGNLLRLTAASVTSGNVPSFSDITGRVVGDSGVVAANIVSNTRQVIAGAGLTGGGSLTSDVTLNVIANADGSIVVAADDVKVGVLATDAQHGNRGNGSLHTIVVAGGNNGFMSGTDKTKLDGITSGAAVASVGATAPITSSGGTTPNIGITISPGAATTAVGTTRNLTAGTGLTGGGDLSADRAFNVVANADGSIVANADDIQVGILATDAQHGNRGNGSLHTVVVAGGNNGFMSGTDKTKLDGITAGAAVSVVSGTAPIVSSGGTTPAISISAATTTAAGSMSATDKKRMQQAYDAVADFGFVGDLITTNATTSMGASTTTLTDTSNPFVSTDVGKRITVPRAGAGTTPNIAQLTTTIATFVNSGQVTLTAPSTNAVSGVSVSYGTDNTTAITNMVNTVNNSVYASAKIIFGESATNAYGFPTTVTFNKTVQIEGIGGSYSADSGDYTKTQGTRLAWVGTSSDGGTAFTPFFTVSPTGVQSLKRTAFRHCWLDCRNNDQNQAVIGLKLASCHGFMLDDFFVMDALAIGVQTDIATSPTEAKDTTRFSITNFSSRQLDNTPSAVTTPFLMTSGVVLTTTPQSLTVAANTLPTSGYLWTATTIGSPILVNYTGGGGTTTLAGCSIELESVVHTPTTVNGGNIVQATPGNGCSLFFNGGTAANSCCSIVQMAELSIGTTWGPAGIETANSDSIDFISVYINGGNATNDGAVQRIRKPGVRVNGSIVSATLASRNQTFRGGSAGAGGLSCMGVNNAGARLLAQSGPTYWDLYQLGNGEGLPVIESNPAFQFEPNGGYLTGKCGTVLIAQQASIPAATLTTITNSIIPVPTATFFQAGVTYRWTVLMTKTAAGVASRTFRVHLGTAGTSADTAIAVFTNALIGTAAVGAAMLEVFFTIRTVPSPAGAGATGIAYSVLTCNGNVGFSTTNSNVTAGTMASWNTSTAQQFWSLSVTTGTAEVISVDMCIPQCISSGNP